MNGSREEIIRWLTWNDPNGVWSDDDSAAEGWRPMDLEQARASMREVLGGAPRDLKVAYSTVINFDPNLPADADQEKCREWLRKLCRDFGLGFHPDSPADDYIDGDGLPFPPAVVSALDESVNRAFELLGDEVYDIGAEVGQAMLAELISRSESEAIRGTDTDQAEEDPLSDRAR